jgi:hypothetical protein
MIPLFEDEAPLSLTGLAVRIRRSSNFRFNWQCFSFDAVPAPSAAEALGVLRKVVSEPACNRFLEDSFNPLYEPAFKIAPIHEHCSAMEATQDFPRVLARAATDRLGAYSRELVDAPLSEVEVVRGIFSPLAPYSVFSLEPGNVEGCAVCATYNHHLFTNWFYGVAWDWCFCLLSHRTATAWVGCLTDTD